MDAEARLAYEQEEEEKNLPLLCFEKKLSCVARIKAELDKEKMS